MAPTKLSSPSNGGPEPVNSGENDNLTDTSLSYEAKVAIALVYEQLKEGNPHIVTPDAVAAAVPCSSVTAFQVMNEIELGGGVIDPATNAYRAVGFSNQDEQCLHWLRAMDPSRTLTSYQRELYQQTGTFASTLIIFYWLSYGQNYMAVSGQPTAVPSENVQPNKVPSDSIQPKADPLEEFLWTVGQFDPRRIKFGGEKLLKGSSIAKVKVQCDPMTGEVPSAPTYPDANVTYTALGIVGIDPSVPPMYYWLHDKPPSQLLLTSFVKHAVATGWLRSWDILVLNKASVNRLGTVSDLEGWLWNEHRIFLLPLPANANTWNPMFEAWKAVVERIRKQLLAGNSSQDNDVCAQAAIQVMTGMHHNVVASCYRKCQYIT